MRADGVVLCDPSARQFADFIDRIEQVSIENLIPIGAVESFNEAVLIRLARLDVFQLDAPGCPLARHRRRGELWTVIDANALGRAA